MGSRFSKSPASYVGIEDPTIGFYFDVECIEALVAYENEREQRQLEMLGMGRIESQISGGPKVEIRSSADIGDRSF